MHAMVHHQFGRASEVLRLEEVETPQPGEGEVLVRVEASSANPYDWHFIRGEPWFMRLGPGDEVYGFSRGAFAEYLAAPHGRLARKPAGLGWEEAASLPLAGATALQGLKEVGGIEAGQNVLIIGASGGVGSLAVQMAKAWGAAVTGVASTVNVDLVRDLGADHVIDDREEDFLRGDDRYDLAFQLGGTASPLAIRHVLADRGTLVLCAGDGDRLLGPMRNVIKGLGANRFVSQTIALVNTREDTAALDAIREMVEAGELRPVVDHAVDFQDAGFAVDEVETGSPRGKVTISGFGREAPLG